MKLADLEMRTIERSAQIEQMVAQARIPNTLLVTQQADSLINETIVRLVREVAYVPGPRSVNIPAMTVPEIKIDAVKSPGYKVPATWWDGFKELHFDVLKRWFPVRYSYIGGETLRDAQVLQERHVVGGKIFEARMYIPDLQLPGGTRMREYRWHEIDYATASA